MPTTTSISESAEHSGQAWGARARDWGETEHQQLPTYEAAIRRAGIGAGQTVLDVGCGTGVFLRAAADHGASVCGLDASAGAARDRPRARARGRPLPGRPAAAALRRRQLRRRLRLQLVLLRRRHGRGAARGRPRRQARRARRDPGVRPPRGVRPPPHEGRPRALHAAARRPGRVDPAALWEPGALEALADRGGPRPRVAPSTSRWAFEYADEPALDPRDDVGGRLRRDRRPRAPGRGARRDRRGARGLPHARRRLPPRERVALPDRPRRASRRRRTRRRRACGP